jgi:hypothetical protein
MVTNTPRPLVTPTPKPAAKPAPFVPVQDDGLTLEIERYDEQCPQGTHPARLIDIVDVGEETSTHNGKEKTQHKLWLVWQVFPLNEEAGDGSTLRQSSGAPFKADKKYTRSLFPGNDKVQASGLFTDIDTWTGGALSGGKLKKFSLNDLYNVPCLVTIEHKAGQGDAVYVNVISVEPFDGDVPPEAERDNYERSDYSKRKPKPKQEAPTLSSSPFIDQSQLPKTDPNFVPF